MVVGFEFVEVEGDAVAWPNFAFLAAWRSPDLALGFSEATAVALDGIDAFDFCARGVIDEVLQNLGSWVPEA